MCLKINSIKYLIAFVFLFSNALSYAQLSDFNLNVTATDETCSGNGAIQISVSNTTAGSTITYTLFLLPDDVNPIAQTSDNFFNSLPAGDYRVVALQILNGEENFQQQDVTINNLITQLDFEVTHTTITDCDSDGTISVNVQSGIPVLYEIISGSQTVGTQSSNVFPNLPAGTYVIRVFDNCGNAVSKSYTMLLETNNISISNAALPVVYTACDQAEITNTISAFPNSPIIYPLLITYTIIPPDGSPDIIFTQNITSGSSEEFDVSQLITLFGDQVFIVNMAITDSCNNLFEVNHTIDPNPKVLLNTRDANCGELLDLLVENYLPPYFVDFTTSPAGFNPLDYNANYPGPYTDSSITFGIDTPVPIGLYTVNVVDACGRMGTFSIIVEDPIVEPIVNTSNSGCTATSGFIGVTITDREIVSASIIDAPLSYNETLPFNLNSFINNGILLYEGNLPVGDYMLSVIDDCGIEYILEAIIPEFEFQELNILALPNCEDATGSVTLSSNHDNLDSVIITSAPQTFTEALPFNVSTNINNSGVFYINDLPIGDYVFESTDLCGFQYTTDVNVFSYSSNPNVYSISRNCGSFDITINDFDETIINQTYWFQMYFPDTNSWGHPNTGAEYVEGELPNETTAINLENSETLFNIFLTGDFRLIKMFQSTNTEDPDAFCLDVFANFSVFSDLVISGVYNLDCSGGSDSLDIIVDVIGVQPYNFSITSPFNLDNGDNNTFLDLANGTYDIRVEDACGSIENITVNLENLLPLARANVPDNMSVCRDDLIEADVFLLTDQNLQILGNQNPNNYNVSYHLSQSEANTGDNPLPDSYSNISNPQTIYARVTHNSLVVCYATTSFQIFVGQTPILSPEEVTFICIGSTVTLTADSGFDDYLWSTGATTQSITVDQPGDYLVTVTNNYNGFSCENTKQFVVISSEIATVEDVTITDWTLSNNSITVLVSGIGDYQYSIDNINFQSSNTFTNLQPGMYTVYITDLNGCGTVTEEVFLLNYPHFFTPNGDDTNEFWQIEFASTEPELKVVIFDRYGKFITQFGSFDTGWDGTYNGNNMPTSDYWFEVTRANGLVYKGHFTLKR
ncbi:T9SS type B sorting domain-containing protein [Olleya sp. R77988]|uniref:T9SS type B sorting domain-containing protein n=1 Tax=Olleya sp. R77988 TaxID=3093875 RepID=UPI0037CA6950